VSGAAPQAAGFPAFSLPGEWLTAEGLQPPLRPDAIGVLLPGGPELALAAEPALARLRAGFPEARIAILAAPGTGAVALALGVADTAPADWSAETLDPFDLLIDLRAGSAERESLPDARLYAGIGDGAYLAIAVPAPHRVPSWAMAEEAVPIAPVRVGLLEISLEAEGAHSPASAGIGADTRPLGFALTAVSLTDLGAGGGPVAQWDNAALAGLLGEGWHDAEPWGAWSSGPFSTLRLPQPPGGVGPYRAWLRLRGHVHGIAPEAAGVLHAEGGAAAAICATLDRPVVEASLTLPVPAPPTEEGGAATPSQMLLAAWALLVEGCVARGGQAPAPLRLAAMAEALPQREAAIAARDAGEVVVALLPASAQAQGQSWPEAAWAELEAVLAAQPGVLVLRLGAEIGLPRLAAMLAVVDLAVGDGGLALALAARQGLRCIAVLDAAAEAPAGPALSWIRDDAAGAVAPGHVLALLAPEIALLRQQRR